MKRQGVGGEMSGSLSDNPAAETYRVDTRSSGEMGLTDPV